MFIVYDGLDEVLVTTEDLEKEMLIEWFKDTNRDIDEYERKEMSETAVLIRPRLRVG